MTQPLRPRAFTLIELPKAVSRSAALTTSKGFTLIELLVVITIIVVLLALLSPALDRAVYQAQLAVCASQLKAIATGSIVYASGNKRFYPHRYWRTAGDGRPNAISYPGWGDDRPVFAGFVSLDAFVDPMVEDIRIDAGSGSGTDTWVYISRTVWAGWKYPKYGGMLRLGDRLTYRDLDNPANTRQFDILAADMDTMRNNLSEVLAAHPDEEGKLALTTVVPDALRVLPHLFSEWRRSDGNRGVIDAFNYAHADGSVSRLNKIEPTHGQNAPGDQRTRGLNIQYTDNSEYNFFIPPAD